MTAFWRMTTTNGFNSKPLDIIVWQHNAWLILVLVKKRFKFVSLSVNLATLWISTFQTKSFSIMVSDLSPQAYAANLGSAALQYFGLEWRSSFQLHSCDLSSGVTGFNDKTRFWSILVRLVTWPSFIKYSTFANTSQRPCREKLKLIACLLCANDINIGWCIDFYDRGAAKMLITLKLILVSYLAFNSSCNV